MKDFFSKIKKEIAAVVSKAAGVDVQVEMVGTPPDPKLGDFTLPCFPFAKIMKISPGEAAIKIHAALKPWGAIANIELAGPYINFWLEREKAFREILKFHLTPLLQKGRQKRLSPFGKGRVGEGFYGQRIMIEYVSPNNNKPLHLGHLRNAFLGESVARLLESQGAKVFRACLFNDRGLHIAKSMLAYQLWGNGTTPKSTKKKGDKFVGDLYVEFEKEQKKFEAQGRDKTIFSKGILSGAELRVLEKRIHKELKSPSQEAEELVQKWEQGDKTTRALWKKLSDWALDGAGTTLKRLGVTFDVVYFENKLWEKGKAIVADGLKKGVFRKNDTGAVAADLEAFHLPEKVVLRSDGTAIYATTDLYLGEEKFGKKKLTRAIWCVGGEQDLYLKQLFAMYRLLGYPWADRCEHLSYGLVFLPEGKMKSREGKVVEADDLLDELHQDALRELRSRQKLSEKEFARRAEAIAQAALRFYFLAVTPPSIVHFNPKESLAFTGRTGPYLLYTYARIASLLRKAKKLNNETIGQSFSHSVVQSVSDHAWRLSMKLTRFSEVTAVSAMERNPAHLATYLFELCQDFAAFYEAIPVLVAGVQRASRLALCGAVKQTLQQGLHLLGIKPLEEM